MRVAWLRKAEEAIKVSRKQEQRDVCAAHSPAQKAPMLRICVVSAQKKKKMMMRSLEGVHSARDSVSVSVLHVKGCS